MIPLVKKLIGNVSATIEHAQNAHIVPLRLHRSGGIAGRVPATAFPISRSAPNDHLSRFRRYAEGKSQTLFGLLVGQGASIGEYDHFHISFARGGCRFPPAFDPTFHQALTHSGRESICFSKIVAKFGWLAPKGKRGTLKWKTTGSRFQRRLTLWTFVAAATKLMSPRHRRGKSGIDLSAPMPPQARRRSYQPTAFLCQSGTKFTAVLSAAR